MKHFLPLLLVLSVTAASGQTKDTVIMNPVPAVASGTAFTGDQKIYDDYDTIPATLFYVDTSVQYDARGVPVNDGHVYMKKSGTYSAFSAATRRIRPG